MWSVSHVNRKANHVAHNLAKAATSLDMDLYAMELVPECIRQEACLDCMETVE